MYTTSFTCLLKSVNRLIWKKCVNKKDRHSHFISVTTDQLNWRNHLIGVLRVGLWMAPLLAHHLDREADWRLYSGGRPRHYIGSACLVETFFQANPELKPKLFYKILLYSKTVQAKLPKMLIFSNAPNHRGDYSECIQCQHLLVFYASHHISFIFK